jgi:hypothetical protein
VKNISTRWRDSGDCVGNSTAAVSSHPAALLKSSFKELEG